MKVKDHYLYDDKGVRVTYKASPNHGGVLKPTYGVIHYDASPNETGAISWMVSPTSKVSAHLHITRSGKITQLLAFNVVAHHAGKSAWKGLNGLNSYSIGIELQNTGKQEYTEVQMKALIEVSRAINEAYPIKEWVGHSDISPGRKQDPGSMFDWKSFRSALGGKKEECKDYRYTSSDLNMRKGGGTHYSIVTVLPKGTKMQVLSDENGWCLVFLETTKQTGYVNSNYLNK